MKRDRHAPTFRVILLDLLILNLISFFFVFFVKKYNFKAPRGGEHYLLLLILFNLVWVIINVIITRYRMELNRTICVEIKKIIAAIILFTGVISIFAFLFKSFLYSRLIIYGSIIVFFVFLIGSHWIFYLTLGWIRKKSAPKKRVLIMGEQHAAIELSNDLLKDNEGNYEVVVYIDSETLERKENCQFYAARLSDIESVFKEDKFDELFIMVSSSPGTEIRKIVEIADYYGIRVKMVPGFYQLFDQNFKVKLVDNIPVINVNETPLDEYYKWLYKRLFDIFFSIFALLLASPLLIIIGCLVKLTSRGPVLYKAKRVGMGGDVFHLYKFRTMYHIGKNPDTLSTRENDMRLTTLGRFLRKNDADELPQFINVLKGQMSVVGPRPHRVYLDKKLQNEVNKYMLRHYVKPGITGWAQVNGWRGPTQTEEQRNQRNRHDLWYIKNWTFWLDMKIIFLTIFGKKVRKNAF